jgi:hypothetical protein
LLQARDDGPASASNARRKCWVSAFAQTMSAWP